MGNATEDAIREGITAGTTRVFGNKLQLHKLVAYPNWLEAVIEEVAGRLPHTELDDDAMAILDAELHQRIKHTVIDIGENIQRVGCNLRSPLSGPEFVFAWIARLRQVSAVIYEMTEESDALSALRLISMTPAEWDDYTEGCNGD